MSGEIKKGYKQTEVGVIPEEWEVVALNTVTTQIGDGLHGTPVYSSNSEYYFINGNNLCDGKIFITNETKSIEYSEYLKHKNPLGDSSILMSINGTIGNLAIYMNELVVLGKSAAFINVSRRFSRDFIYHALQTTNVRQQFFGGLTGSTIGNLGLATIRSTKIPIPSRFPEQRAIAAALGDADALIAGLERLIAKKRDLKQAAMQQLLTGQTRLPGFHGEWVPLNMADNSTLKARIGWQGLTTAEYLKTGDYFLVTGTDFLTGRIAWSSCCFVAAERYTQDRNIQLRSRDILLTKDGTIGKVAYVDHLPGPATLNSGVFVIRPKNEAYDPHFFYYILTSRIFDEFLNKLAAGSTISHLYQKDFVTFSFLAPATIREQSAIASVLSDMDAELASLESRLAKARAIKQGMMQELLTGRIRLL